MKLYLSDKEVRIACEKYAGKGKFSRFHVSMNRKEVKAEITV